MRKHISTFKERVEMLNEQKSTDNYVLTIEENSIPKIDDIIGILENIGCTIKNKFPFGVIVVSYIGDMNDLNIDGVEKVSKEKIASI